MTSVELLGVLYQYNDSSNMADAQNDSLHNLAKNTKVRIIKRILNTFSYCRAKTAEEYGMSKTKIEALLIETTATTNLASFCTIL